MTAAHRRTAPLASATERVHDACATRQLAKPSEGLSATRSSNSNETFDGSPNPREPFTRGRVTHASPRRGERMNRSETLAERSAPPIGELTHAQIADMYHISVRMLERAIRVRRHGVPELSDMVDRGELKIGPAEAIANLPHDEQREVIARGPAAVRQLAAKIRRKPSLPRAVNYRTRCPHCGGEL